MAASDVRIGVLRGRENSFPDAFIAKVNSMGKGVTAEFVQLGGHQAQRARALPRDPRPHEPRGALLLGLPEDGRAAGHLLHQQHLLAHRRRQVLRLRGGGEARHRRAEDGGAAQPRATWTTSPRRACATSGPPTSRCTPTTWALPCIMKPAFGGGWKDVNKIHTPRRAACTTTTRPGTKTMMLQEFITWDTYIRVPTIGRRWARAIRYDPAPGGLGGYNQDYDILPRALRDKAEELSLRFNQALGYDMNALEFAVKDGTLLRHRPHQLHARPRLPEPEGRPLPLGGREDGGVRGREGALEGSARRSRPTGRACCSSRGQVLN